MPAPQTHTPPRHLVMIDRFGESIYIDRISNASIMRDPVVSDAVARTTFCSFLIGWQDSTVNTDQERQRQREKYFQYDMQKGWVALVQGDSLYPVFFQERTGTNRQIKEGVMVFELPQGTHADTLIYKDGYGNWGVQTFVLNQKPSRRHA